MSVDVEQKHKYTHGNDKLPSEDIAAVIYVEKRAHCQ